MPVLVLLATPARRPVMTGRATILRGDARALPLQDASVDLIVTSPPYWALRSYTDGGEHYAGQIGSEPTPAAYVDALIGCTREWVRVLKPSGSLFVNLGDVYYSGKGAPGRTTVDAKTAARIPRRAGGNPLDGPSFGVGRKSLVGLPWRYALRCIDDLGLILRAELIWSKPNGLPESVTDRVRRSHEQWFHLVKQPRYYAAVDEIRQPSSGYSRPPGAARATPPGVKRRAMADTVNALGALPGSVWDIPTEPLQVPVELGVDHFAAFPSAWPRRLILGWSPPGICTACGEGRRPVVAAVGLDMSRPQARRAHELAAHAGLGEQHLAALRAVGVSDTGRGAATQSGTGKNTLEVYALAAEARVALGGYAREYLLRRPTRFEYRCACPEPTAPTRPAVVLDPCGGTGTTALVARALGRHGITVDRSADYCHKIARWRVNDPGQLAKAAHLPKPPKRAPASGSQPALFQIRDGS
jgi:DNA modification methylase